MLKRNLIIENKLSSKYRLYIYDTVENTIDEAFKHDTGTILVAYHQSYGIGQYGRQWNTYKDNLLMSIHESEIRDIHLANQILSYTSLLTLNEYKEDLCYLKYPNDIYTHGKKIGGVISHYRKRSAVYSVGLNLNNAELITSISLADIIKQYINVNIFIYKWIINYQKVLSKKLFNGIESNNIFKIP